MVVRTYEDELRFIERETRTRFRVKPGFVPNMRVPGLFYVNSALEPLIFEELKHAANDAHGGYGGFLPAVKQLANVAALPGIVKASIGLPDIHLGYGFAIGNVRCVPPVSPRHTSTMPCHDVYRAMSPRGARIPPATQRGATLLLSRERAEASTNLPRM